MSYVMKMINSVNKQVSDNGDPRQMDFNIQSLKKAMTSFRDFNDEYVANLEDSAFSIHCWKLSSVLSKAAKALSISSESRHGWHGLVILRVSFRMLIRN